MSDHSHRLFRHIHKFFDAAPHAPHLSYVEIGMVELASPLSMVAKFTWPMMPSAAMELKPRMSKADIKQLQTQFGWGYVKNDILLDGHLRLDAISVTMVDWSHTYIASGVADLEFGESMHSPIPLTES